MLTAILEPQLLNHLNLLSSMPLPLASYMYPSLHPARLPQWLLFTLKLPNSFHLQKMQHLLDRESCPLRLRSLTSALAYLFLYLLSHPEPPERNPSPKNKWPPSWNKTQWWASNSPSSSSPSTPNSYQKKTIKKLKVVTQPNSNGQPSQFDKPRRKNTPTASTWKFSYKIPKMPTQIIKPSIWLWSNTDFWPRISIKPKASLHDCASFWLLYCYCPLKKVILGLFMEDLLRIWINK